MLQTWYNSTCLFESCFYQPKVTNGSLSASCLAKNDATRCLRHLESPGVPAAIGASHARAFQAGPSSSSVPAQCALWPKCLLGVRFFSFLFVTYRAEDLVVLTHLPSSKELGASQSWNLRKSIVLPVLSLAGFGGGRSPPPPPPPSPRRGGVVTPPPTGGW